MLEFIAKTMITLEEHKTSVERKGTRGEFFNAGIQVAQNILLDIYDHFAPKKLNETHYLTDNDLIYEFRPHR